MEFTQPLPPGWECLHSAEAGRKYIYFVDHVHKKTQWDDPRLTHPFIWGDTENKALQQLKQNFGSVAENELRKCLLRHSFDVEQVVAELKSHHEELTPPATTTVAKQSSLSPRLSTTKRSDSRRRDSPALEDADAEASSNANRRRSHSSVGDGQAESQKLSEFAFLSVKSKFASLPDAVIADVLLRCNNDEEKALHELKAMGFDSVSRRQAAFDRAERVEIDDVEKSKMLLLKRNEAISQIMEEFPTLSKDEITHVYDQTKEDLMEARSVLRLKESKEKMIEMSAIFKSSQVKQVNTDTHNVDPPTQILTGPQKDSLMRNQNVGTIGQVANRPYKSIAFGSDKSLLSGSGSLAKGPNKGIRCGPNPALLEFASFSQYIHSS